MTIMLKTGIVLWDRYKILRQIGRGGMGSVYLAEDIETSTMKAIKETFNTAAEIGTSYLKELNHPGLPRIEEVIHYEESTLIIMEYVEGFSLQEILVKYGAQPYKTLMNWMIRLCEILSYLHSRVPPIIYRDLKPSNVILRPDGSLKLIDFGAAREYREGGDKDTVLLGTRGYAAPEQYGGYGQSGPPADIYGLGATIFHLATGRDPAKPPYMRYPMTRWARDIPEEFSRIVLKCTNLDAEKRYPDCKSLMLELLALKGSQDTDKSYIEGQSPDHCWAFSSDIRHADNRFSIETDITIVYTDRIIS